MSGGVFVRFRLLRLAVMGIVWSANSFCVSPMTHGFTTILSPLAFSYAALDCPWSSLAFILIHNISSGRSVVGRWFSQLATFPICYTPRQVSPSDKLGDDSVMQTHRLYQSTAASPGAGSYINPRNRYNYLLLTGAPDSLKLQNPFNLMSVSTSKSIWLLRRYSRAIK